MLHELLDDEQEFAFAATQHAAVGKVEAARADARADHSRRRRQVERRGRCGIQALDLLGDREYERLRLRVGNDDERVARDSTRVRYWRQRQVGCQPGVIIILIISTKHTF